MGIARPSCSARCAALRVALVLLQAAHLRRRLFAGLAARPVTREGAALGAGGDARHRRRGRRGRRRRARGAQRRRREPRRGRRQPQQGCAAQVVAVEHVAHVHGLALALCDAADAEHGLAACVPIVRESLFALAHREGVAPVGWRPI
eukprot:7283606-Prymnesium_polylepis.1